MYHMVLIISGFLVLVFKVFSKKLGVVDYPQYNIWRVVQDIVFQVFSHETSNPFSV